MERLLGKVIELMNISGSNDKKQFIRDNKDNEEFIRLIQFQLNTYIVTGISKKKISKNVYNGDTELETIWGCVEYLK